MASLFDLTGKVALVTGGNNGIGLGMADGLAAHGATVVIWGTNGERNAEAAEKLRVHGGEVRSAQIDVSDEAAVAKGVADIIAEFGRLDQAIANAGISISRKSLFDISVEDFRKIEEVNMNSVLPGWTRSGMTAGLQEWDKFTDAVISRVPTGDWLDGSDFAAIAVYLASRGSRNHTGDTIVIDGGYTIY
jgi:NAD(P)-dependent dehydrogenase (short-subunit alcohol dehydrogenase family)